MDVPKPLFNRIYKAQRNRSNETAMAPSDRISSLASILQPVKMSKPPFSALPLRKDGPRGNAWGLFGEKDECGMLNLLTPETTIAAAREIQDGTRVSTDWPLDSMSNPWFGRRVFGHTIKHKEPRVVNDDELVLNTQSSSQWDGFRHFGYQDERVYFNGTTQEQVLNSTVIGTDGAHPPVNTC